MDNRKLKNNSYKLLQMPSGKQADFLKWENISYMRFSNDGRWLKTTNKDDSRNMWELSTGKQPLFLNGEDIVTIEFSPNGKWAVTRHKNDIARLWDLSSSKEADFFYGKRYFYYLFLSKRQVDGNAK
jgi:WD40 repeat protein